MAPLLQEWNLKGTGNHMGRILLWVRRTEEEGENAGEGGEISLQEAFNIFN